MLNYAVDTLGARPNAKVYLDGTHSGWLNIGENTSRLVRAGIADADGFFLNVSNYQYTTNSVIYGRWISECLAYVTEVKPGDYLSCGNIFWNGGAANKWKGVPMDPYGGWRSG